MKRAVGLGGAGFGTVLPSYIHTCGRVEWGTVEYGNVLLQVFQTNIVLCGDVVFVFCWATWGCVLYSIDF